jgi:hypothetical protein
MGEKRFAILHRPVSRNGLAARDPRPRPCRYSPKYLLGVPAGSGRCSRGSSRWGLYACSSRRTRTAPTTWSPRSQRSICPEQVKYRVIPGRLQVPRLMPRSRSLRIDTKCCCSSQRSSTVFGDRANASWSSSTTAKKLAALRDPRRFGAGHLRSSPPRFRHRETTRHAIAWPTPHPERAGSPPPPLRP